MSQVEFLKNDVFYHCGLYIYLYIYILLYIYIMSHVAPNKNAPMSHVEEHPMSNVVSFIFILMSLRSMSHVEFRKPPCRHVEFNILSIKSHSMGPVAVEILVKLSLAWLENRSSRSTYRLDRDDERNCQPGRARPVKKIRISVCYKMW